MRETDGRTVEKRHRSMTSRLAFRFASRVIRNGGDSVTRESINHRRRR